MQVRRTPRRQLKGEPTAGDRFMRLNMVQRAGLIGHRFFNKTDRYLVIPEPAEELEGSELSDGERQQAILREKTRREGLT